MVGITTAELHRCEKDTNVPIQTRRNFQAEVIERKGLGKGKFPDVVQPI